jgi:hypothetical protein
MGLDGINALASAAVDGQVPTSALGPESPIWFRGYVNEPEAQACPQLAEALRALDARRMVVGHTTQESGQVLSRCGGALLVIDVGIADHYGGHLGAIELVDGDARAISAGGPRDLPDPK